MINLESPSGHQSCHWAILLGPNIQISSLGDRRLPTETEKAGCHSEITDTHITRFEVLTAVTLKIHVLQDVSCVAGLVVPDVSKQHSDFIFMVNCVTMKIKAASPFETSRTTRQMTWRATPEVVNI